MRIAIIASVLMAAVTVVAVAWWTGGPTEALSAMTAVAMNAAVVGLTVPVVRHMAKKHGSLAAGKAFVAMGLVRLPLLLGAGIAVTRLWSFAGTRFWFWVVGVYVVLLCAEAYLTSMFLAGQPTKRQENGSRHDVG